MHELSLCRAIADTAIEHADGRAVLQINLRIGHFRQVIPETLQYCWDLQVKGSVLDSARLLVESVAAVVRCQECGVETTLNQPILRCGSCQATAVDLISGEEFLIESIDLAPVHAAGPAPEETR